MASTLTVADVVGLLEQRYPPRTAEGWDAVGLVAGDPDAPVRTVMFAVDPVQAVADEAIAAGVDLLVTHHPLYLRGTTSVAATTPKGRVVHDLVRAGCALYTAHTNADSAAGGVADALADLLDLSERHPLTPHDAAALDTLTVFVPREDTAAVLDALAAAGAGAIGDYDRCAFTVAGQGTFRPGAAANPTIGARGEVTEVAEDRLEMTVPRERRAAVLAALRAAHPYEEPAFSVLEHATRPAGTGIGRIGTLPARTTLRALAERVAAALPATAQGIRVAGDLDAEVSRVAVCGGSGDSLLGTVRALGADVYLTADLRHHPASEALEAGPPYLIDATHWASEWPWLPVAAARLEADARESGAPLRTRVSTIVTDPWTLRLGAPDNGTTTDNEGVTP
ncbi:dinuclear metal center protein, YbgI/SA1388 family [Georgenia satyanarayanai]|uniref:GTP cyclohydrolase 1 type 2 homolog n=1 Tax=Georgenia satyanarayanai TaxID=860221 RepID=A0A2Y9A206_9MICO|nr:Nif3-like dinuclear metal center hexameric protein [Georgenia satyanarayanai]PYG01719.1 dinuclear metal center YbgI/SA1388 family protein [Georgenia satyanarayanai]SSA36519.1 dinuclear metal center protein, YbgI/SA1388 family [Georgenia satyanarayanai]